MDVYLSLKRVETRAAQDDEDLSRFDKAGQAFHTTIREAFLDIAKHEPDRVKVIDADGSRQSVHARILNALTARYPQFAGIGKATLAYRIARHRLGGGTLLDDSLDIPPNDPVSQRIESQGHGNLSILRRLYDTKSKRLKRDIPVDEVRALAKFFQSTAAESDDWRVCIVDKADDLNPNSENGILKLLEEPPVRTLFLLLADQPGRLLPTIRSRCLHLPLRPVPSDDIERWLSGRTDVRPEFLQAAIALSRGAPGKALALVGHVETVLHPLKRLMQSMNGSGDDMMLAKSLASAKEATARALFWDALTDTLHAQAIFAGTGDWTGPFAPIEAIKSPAKWIALAEKTQATRAAEEGINLDKTASLYDLLSQIRAA